MRSSRLAIVVMTGSLAVGAIVGSDPAPAVAGGPNEPIVADLNLDGRPDMAELDASQGGSTDCVVLVRLGAPGGGLLPPTRHTYLVLPSDSPCPDLGVAVDMFDAPETDLVVGWFAGRPPGVDFDLLLLRNYTVTDGFEAIFQPSFIGRADFNGDGRPDVYEWTDQGEGFATYLNTGTGKLVPGPVKYCSGPLQYRLADFNRNGAMDVAIAYIEGCGTYFSGVVVVLDDGTQVDLQGDVAGVESWNLEVIDANGDGIPDVTTYAQIGGQVTTFIGVGNGTFVRAPVAIRDTYPVSGVKTTGLRVLANDYATTRAKVTIWTPPRYGTVKVTTNGVINYTPNPVHGHTDRFVYRITDEGRTSNAAVSLTLVG
ncbi:hypothetical protein GCM10022225_04760 [Plantactinospora mayteni]|uniref:VCBS repeat-containing protein n=1 Tax=Plantactinospora mayteni TaxID=566021 RepID=A0ABQ4EQR7_9ACTN|nr:FG-GAP-like repeat-containing protein [Plantactinospora mayteni]GIG96965.1 hypothetical protein Pma05_35380 [Plantactinospora mayteni]